MTRLQITLCKIILHPPEGPDNIQMDDPITQEQFNDNLFNIRSMISDLRLGCPDFRNIVRNNGLRVYLNSYDGFRVDGSEINYPREDASVINEYLVGLLSTLDDRIHDNMNRMFELLATGMRQAEILLGNNYAQVFSQNQLLLNLWENYLHIFKNSAAAPSSPEGRQRYIAPPVVGYALFLN